jgi:hypothetical protein
VKSQHKNINLAPATVSTILCFWGGIGWGTTEQLRQRQIQGEHLRNEMANYRFVTGWNACHGSYAGKVFLPKIGRENMRRSQIEIAKHQFEDEKITKLIIDSWKRRGYVFSL